MASEALKFVVQNPEYVPEYQDGCKVHEQYIVVDANLEGFKDSVYRVLVGGGTHEFPGLARRYNPFDEPKIWLEFALLEPTEDDVIRFASKYGRLGHHSASRYELEQMPQGFCPEDCHPLYDDDESPWGDFPADEIKDWFTELQKIKPLFYLWRLLESTGHSEYLKLEQAVIASQGMHNLVADFGDGFAPRGHRTRRSTKRRVFLNEFGIHSGNYTIEDAVRAFLHREVSQVLSDELPDSVRAKMIWDRKSKRSRIVFSPLNLIGMIWFQFAQALEGKGEFRRCARDGCPKFFAITPSNSSKGKRKGRNDRVWCSDACKTKASELRQKQKAAIPVTNP